jgi:hypothetical protein
MSPRGVTVSSLTFLPKYSGKGVSTYAVDAFDGLAVQQSKQNPDVLAFDDIPSLSTQRSGAAYKRERSDDGSLSADLKACLNSSTKYIKRTSSGRGSR